MDECYPRIIKSTIACTYYDTTQILNSVQNNMVHYEDIENIGIYKCFNSPLTQEIVVKDVNFLYFLAQSELKLELTSASSVVLFCKTFYLYQPSISFSFRLMSLTKDECPVYVHCLYANVENPNSLTNSNLFKTKLDYEV